MARVWLKFLDCLLPDLLIVARRSCVFEQDIDLPEFLHCLAKNSAVIVLAGYVSTRPDRAGAGFLCRFEHELFSARRRQHFWRRVRRRASPCPVRNQF